MGVVNARERRQAGISRGGGDQSPFAQPFSASAVAARMALRMQVPRPVFIGEEGSWHQRGGPCHWYALILVRCFISWFSEPIGSLGCAGRPPRYRQRHRVTPPCVAILCRDAGWKYVLRRGTSHSTARDRRSCCPLTEASPG